jgi:hypothetical protein
MKKVCKLLGLLGALALGTTLVSAADVADLVQVNIPFSFVLAGKAFPAGQYRIKETDAGLLLVQGEGGAGIALTVPAEKLKAAQGPALTFTANNGREYLVRVQGAYTTRAVPVHLTDGHALTMAR